MVFSMLSMKPWLITKKLRINIIPVSTKVITDSRAKENAKRNTLSISAPFHPQALNVYDKR